MSGARPARAITGGADLERQRRGQRRVGVGDTQQRASRLLARRAAVNRHRHRGARPLGVARPPRQHRTAVAAAVDALDRAARAERTLRGAATAAGRSRGQTRPGGSSQVASAWATHSPSQAWAAWSNWQQRGWLLHTDVVQGLQSHGQPRAHLVLGVRAVVGRQHLDARRVRQRAGPAPVFEMVLLQPIDEGQLGALPDRRQLAVARALKRRRLERRVTRQRIDGDEQLLREHPARFADRRRTGSRSRSARRAGGCRTDRPACLRA